MLDRVYVASIPHTGTRFTIRTLHGWGFVNDYPKVARLTHTHFAESYPEGGRKVEEWIAAGLPVVIPYRSPDLSAASSRKRGEVEHCGVFHLIERWRGSPNVLVFRVDCPEEGRAKEWAALAAFCGVSDPGPVDWTPENEFGGRR